MQFDLHTVNTVEISDEQILKIVETRFKGCLKEYHYINGIIHKLDRVNWNDYDWVPVEDSDLSQAERDKIIKAHNMFETLKGLMK